MVSSDKTVMKNIRVFVRREWLGTELEKERRKDGVTSDFFWQWPSFWKVHRIPSCGHLFQKEISPCKVGSVHECMHWLIKYTNKKNHAHSDIHSITCMATLFNNHPYINSSGTPVGTKFTAIQHFITHKQHPNKFSFLEMIVHFLLLYCLGVSDIVMHNKSLLLFNYNPGKMREWKR